MSSSNITRADVTRAFNQAESQTAIFAKVIAQGNGEWIAEEATARRAQDPKWTPAVQIMQLRRMPREKDAPVITLNWDKDAKCYRLAEAKARKPRADKDLRAELLKLVDAYGLKSVTETLTSIVENYSTAE